MVGSEIGRKRYKTLKIILVEHKKCGDKCKLDKDKTCHEVILSQINESAEKWYEEFRQIRHHFEHQTKDDMLKPMGTIFMALQEFVNFWFDLEKGKKV